MVRADEALSDSRGWGGLGGGERIFGAWGVLVGEAEE